MSLMNKEQEWLKSLREIIDDCSTVSLQSNSVAENAHLEKELLNRANGYIKARLREVNETLATANSKAFIKQHGITPEMVHDFTDDSYVNGLHDFGKIQDYLRKNATKPWFAFEDHLFETKVIQSGESLFDHGYHGRYADLKTIGG